MTIAQLNKEYNEFIALSIKYGVKYGAKEYNNLMGSINRDLSRKTTIIKKGTV